MKTAPQRSLPNTRTLTIVAQDPGIRIGDRILTAEVSVPAETLANGPSGYRVKVVDYDVSTATLYQPAAYDKDSDTVYVDPFKKPGGLTAKEVLGDPRFHAQNVYAVVMRTLARFEFALGRRVAWGSDGHQLHLAPHAFAEANAFYSRADRAIFFGYFGGARGEPIFSCLAHDVIAHEATHALLDGLRGRYMEPSSPDQAAFHEGFADIVALLSVYSVPDVIARLLAGSKAQPVAGVSELIDMARLKREALEKSVLFGLADEMGTALSRVRGKALRRSVELERDHDYMNDPEFRDPHRRGELLVAAVMNAFLDIWLKRMERIGRIDGDKVDLSIVVEDGAKVADHLLTIAIRAIDYCPPTDILFSDYLSALLTIDREVVPDDSKVGYRHALLENFKRYGITPSRGSQEDGTCPHFDKELVYSRTHFESMAHDKHEVFRFIWENRAVLNLDANSYIEVASVRPCMRIGPDGFAMRETVAEYVEIATVAARELEPLLAISPPEGVDGKTRVRVFGGGALIFNEYGQLKFHIANRISDRARQEERLSYLVETGFFDEPADPQAHFAALHLARAIS
jgi:hypothetical protein